MGLSGLLRKILPAARGEPRTAASAEGLRTAFKERYHNFKLLLSANNKALEIMSEMEEALRGTRPFGMSFVRANSTAVLVNVFRMIKYLDELAPGSYAGLHPRFREIQGEINRLLAQRALPLPDRLVFPLEAVGKEMADHVGSKMANLGEIRNRLSLRVPPGFVISSLAYQRFMEHNDLQAEIDRRLQSVDTDRLDELYSLSAGIQQIIIGSPLPEELEAAIMEAYRELETRHGPGVTVSLRSSALAEDAAGTSFAGQYRSVLNVSAENIVQAYKEIVASKYSLPAMTYRFNRGIRDEDIAMCVGCMVMIHAAAGGVMYSRNPVDIRDDSVYINSAWGLPKSVVDGSVTPDLFVVSRGEPMALIRKRIEVKERFFVCDPEEGVCRMDLAGDKGAEPSLTDEQAEELARIALRLEEFYGHPQDVEWAVSPEGAIYVLQCRPLRQRERREIEAKAEAEAGVEGESGGPRAIPAPKFRDEVILEGGATASPGVGGGPVFVIRKEADILRFPQGAVLVAVQSLPRWAALLGRASAVVTEQGSVTGHLANVAREFGVPALFGVPGATERLREGEAVTVDADGLRVYQGRIDSLLAGSRPSRRLMEGSPVHDTLRAVMQYISPLNLLDPDSPEFSPKRCRTLHDITRFCHEKSVQEMFDFGKVHRFPERSSKQLLCQVPMQWWVLNLDDGFKAEVEGRYVELDNIASIPMLALWEGITSVPWQGPPPVDTKGFMSVMVQATANPALDPSMRSPYAARNYFMISRNFCSLNSRFGFHFSVIETLVGERPAENYISFQFKGGAADYHRRVRRTLFVAHILREYGLRVEVKEDAVFARVEGLEEGSMKERLRVLGYLIIHTRQLDMIMANDSSINYHKEKILRDLKWVAKGGRPPEAQEATGLR
jgi:pyruvate,water dikinase